MGVPEGEERQKGTKNFFKEIITENLPNKGETCPQRELNQTDSTKKNLTCYNQALSHQRQRILKAARKKRLIT